MDAVKALTDLNIQFIEAFRNGSWEMLKPILSPSFAYLDGATGEVWAQDRYIAHLEGHPAPSLAIDQLAVHTDGNTAVVSARTSRVSPGSTAATSTLTSGAETGGSVCTPAFGR